MYKIIKKIKCQKLPFTTIGLLTRSSIQLNVASGHSLPFDYKADVVPDRFDGCRTLVALIPSSFGRKCRNGILDKPLVSKNRDGADVCVAQVGWAGIWLGKLDMFFANGNKKIMHNSNNRKI